MGTVFDRIRHEFVDAHREGARNAGRKFHFGTINRKPFHLNVSILLQHVTNDLIDLNRELVGIEFLTEREEDLEAERLEALRRRGRLDGDPHRCTGRRHLEEAEGNQDEEQGTRMHGDSCAAGAGASLRAPTFP